jgi:hypothetical protein
MWRFSYSLGDTPHQQLSLREPRRRRASVRWGVVALVGLALLLIVALLVGWSYLAAPDDAGLMGTVWKHKKGNATITLEFSRLGYIVGNPVIKYTTAEGSPSGQGSVTYTVPADKTLSLASGEQLTIDSVSSEKLVLSGGPWKLDKTEFERQK